MGQKRYSEHKLMPEYGEITTSTFLNDFSYCNGDKKSFKGTSTLVENNVNYCDSNRLMEMTGDLNNLDL